MGELNIITKQSTPEWQIDINARTATSGIAGVIIFTENDNWWGGNIGSNIHKAMTINKSEFKAVTVRERLQNALIPLVDIGLAKKVSVKATAEKHQLFFDVEIDENQILRLI